MLSPLVVLSSYQGSFNRGKFVVKWVFSILQNTWKYSVYADNRKLDIKFDINVVWKSVDDELYVYGGDELYATIDVERKGLLVKLSFYWNQEKLNQNMGG